MQKIDESNKNHRNFLDKLVQIHNQINQFKSSRKRRRKLKSKIVDDDDNLDKINFDHILDTKCPHSNLIHEKQDLFNYKEVLDNILDLEMDDCAFHREKELLQAANLVLDMG